MGISDRKERERQELKNRILDAARQLFLDKGVDNTSIRNIAEIIEYSPGTIYHYFKDKNDILHNLHSEGFRQLRSRMTVLEAVSDPIEHLKALGRVYVQFGLENRDMYDLMFIKDEPMEFVENEEEDCWVEGSTTFDYLKKLIQKCMAKGFFPDQELEPLSFMIWSAVHGIVSLYIRNRTKILSEEIQNSIVVDALESFNKLIDQQK
ncbi:TetR/AcrR family transcriptional regulator [Membranihabitans maritimus]|uniref:TetR/AcrR family transcriptional regulator n=1 Tax=Membranihabitans maritimus TaxID=2904244 RepID=UPI001F2AAD44|nr:TetR/AcrR family transcriptional regulator [Membranihabitans maritimus]